MSAKAKRKKTEAKEGNTLHAWSDIILNRRKQPSAWLDTYHAPNGDIIWGIECDDPSLTFDGHYICLFPQAENEPDDQGAQARANTLLRYMRGEKQFKRES